MKMESNEIAEIRKSWQIPMSDPITFGGTIYVEFFTLYPHNQLKFNKFKNIPANELITTLRFRLHAKRIMQVFDESIAVLGAEDETQKLRGIWNDVAEEHFKRNISKTSYYELKEAILAALQRTSRLTDAQNAAWRKFLNYVYGIIFEKYQELEYPRH